jgi:hypothetical protein
MVLLGGLEFVAAGYVLNELNKDNKKPAKKHSDGKHRKKHRKHEHHHRDSSSSSSSPDRMRPSRPPQQQTLRPPQSGPARPYSAPPPGSRPMWQPQPFQGQPQNWQPNPIAYHPPQQAPVPYPPQQMLNRPPQQMPNRPPQQMPNRPPQQMPNHPPPQIPRPTFNIQAPQINPLYPPAGTYIDMKTGQIQHNLYPPGHEAARSQSDIGFSNVVMNVMDHQRVPSPQLGYAELDSETPGRYRPYDEKRGAMSPPPAYQEYR